MKGDALSTMLNLTELNLIVLVKHNQLVAACPIIFIFNAVKSIQRLPFGQLIQLKFSIVGLSLVLICLCAVDNITVHVKVPLLVMIN